MNKENVIKGLELCTNISQDGCLMLCPYKDEKNETYSGFYEQVLKRDALAMLKEQQQRIEALEIDRDILVKDINTNNCNTCKRKCEHRPELGEIVRVNCFMWEGR